MAIKLTSSKLVRLPLITEGGEAKLYTYEDGKSVAKIYKPHVNISMKEQKVKKFVNAKLPNCVVAPRDIILVDDKFNGYLMDKVENAENLHQLIKPKFLKVCGFDNKDVLEMMVNLGSTLQTLHNGGIIIGDISDYNILIKNKNIYFIDVDSWGAIGVFEPDAYTEIFTDPKAYNSNGRIKFSLDSEYYSFAILSFNMLSRIHPFNGTYEKDANMSTLDRMRKRLSVLGNHKITIPKMIPSWRWMSPDLQKAYLDIFENGKRFDITPILVDQFVNSKYCNIHKMYYYSKYSECPLCSGNAKINVAPVLVRVPTNNGPKLIVVFEANDVSIVLNQLQYFSTSDELVHISTGNRVKMQKRNHIEFSKDGNYIFDITDEIINVYRIGTNVQNTPKYSFERAHKTCYLIRENDLYYVDKNNCLVRLTITPNGNIRKVISVVYNPFFEITSNGDFFVASMYPKKALININNHNFTLDYTGKIREYTIKYDVISQKWLFAYVTSKGIHRSIIFGAKSIEFDSDAIRYNANSLSRICFYNNTIYDPGNGKIIGINYIKNQAKAFDCNVVNENSRLEFDGKKFTIVNEDKIYTFGT